MKIFGRLFANFQQDFKAFAFWCLVFTLFRMVFIAVYSGQLGGDYGDVPEALFLGLRLSLKTAGVIALAGFIAATLPGALCSSWPAKRARFAWHSAVLVFFSICFMARIPYYKIFNAAFNMMLINGANDDIYAIIATAVKEYQLLWRLPVALALGAVLAWCLRKWLAWLPTADFAALKHKRLVAAATLPFLVLLWVFVRYGGGFSYAGSINWESAARLKSNLLNEAVLDDGQALYRVYDTQKKIAKATNVNITPAQLRQKITTAGGNAAAATVDQAFLRTVQAPMLAQQPHNVVLLVGESFGNWPFLPKFMDLGLVDNMLALQNSPNGAHISTMLPNGAGTITAVNGLVTGLPDMGIYVNYQPSSFKQKYASGLGYIMKQLGYKTVFWYGGFSSWQNLENFVLAQSFDEFHCADEMTAAGGNAWGVADEDLLQKAYSYIAAQKDGDKVFHVILTTSNHPPYTIDVDALGFNREAVKGKLPADIAKDASTLTELGHIWYADKTMGEFVNKVQGKQKDTLFVITGDHSERFSFATEQDARTTSTIPCIFYGEGVNKAWFAAGSVGDHVQLAATLAEAVAPSGFTYVALQPSLFADSGVAFSRYLYTTGDAVKRQQKYVDASLMSYISSLRRVSAWRVRKGNNIE